MEKRFVGIDELAEYLGMKKGTIYVWVCMRKIPFLKLGGALRFDLREIESWLKDRRVEVFRLK